jgi:hypothetical protein
MTNPVTFPYINAASTSGMAGYMPFLSLTLRNAQVAITEHGLIDSGAAVNILPFDLGVRLGLDWNSTQGTLPLGGLMAGATAKPVFLEVLVGTFAPVKLAFAWTQWPTARLLLGQTNFFMEFDVCLFRSRTEFQVQPRTP